MNMGQCGWWFHMFMSCINKQRTELELFVKMNQEQISDERCTVCLRCLWFKSINHGRKKKGLMHHTENSHFHHCSSPLSFRHWILDVCVLCSWNQTQLSTFGRETRSNTRTRWQILHQQGTRPYCPLPGTWTVSPMARTGRAFTRLTRKILRVCVCMVDFIWFYFGPVYFNLSWLSSFI